MNIFLENAQQKFYRNITHKMNIRNAAIKTTWWVLISLGVFALLLGLGELYSGFGLIGWPLIFVGMAVTVPALLSKKYQTEGVKTKKWMIMVRCLFALTMLAAYSFLARSGAAFMELTHESDIPGSFHGWLGNWDVNAVFTMFGLLGIFGAARVLLIKQIDFILWSLFGLPASIFLWFRFG